MTSAQGDRQAGVRFFTGTSYDYNGDWEALFDQSGISPDGGFNGRLLAWINLKLGTNYTEINGAMQAYALNQGATNWSSMATVEGQGGGPVVYEPETVAYFARATIQPPQAWGDKVNTFVKAAKDNNILTKFDAIHIISSHDAQCGRLNLVQDLYNWTAVAAPVFTPYQGYQGDGVASYLTCGFVPSTAPGAKFLQSDASLHIFSRTESVSGAISMGSRNTGSIRQANILIRGAGDVFSGRMNADTAPNVTNTSSLGLFSVSRRSSATYTSYRNGVSLGDSAVASTGLSGNNFVLGAVNTGGTIGAFDSRQFALSAWGGGLSPAEVAIFSSMVSTLFQ